MKHGSTLVIGILCAALLASCGGGGGGSTSPTGILGGSGEGTSSGGTGATGSGSGGSTVSTGGDTGGSTAGSGGSTGSSGGPPVQPAAFAAFGPVTLAQGVQASLVADANKPQGPQAARLAGGGAVVVWVSGSTLVAQPIDASGTNVGAPITVATLAGTQWAYSVGGLANGDFVVAWGNETAPQLDNTPHATPDTIQVERFSASGAVVQAAHDVPSGVMFGSIDPHMQVAPTQDGGYIVAWSAAPGSPSNHAAYQRFSPSDAAVGSVVFAPDAGNDTQMNVVPLSDGTIVATWVAPIFTATSTNYALQLQHFDASGNPLNAQPSTVAASTQGAPFEAAATLLPNGNIGLAWTTPSGSFAPAVMWQVVDATGAPVGNAGSQLLSGSNVTGGVAAVPGTSGFDVMCGTVFGFSRGTNAAVMALTLDASGTLASQATLASRSLYTVSPTTGAVGGPSAPGFAVAGGADGHFVLAYESIGNPGAQVSALGQ